MPAGCGKQRSRGRDRETAIRHEAKTGARARQVGTGLASRASTPATIEPLSAVLDGRRAKRGDLAGARPVRRRFLAVVALVGGG